MTGCTLPVIGRQLVAGRKGEGWPCGFPSTTAQNRRSRAMNCCLQDGSHCSLNPKLSVAVIVPSAFCLMTSQCTDSRNYRIYKLFSSSKHNVELLENQRRAISSRQRLAKKSAPSFESASRSFKQLSSSNEGFAISMRNLCTPSPGSSTRTFLRKFHIRIPGAALSPYMATSFSTRNPISAAFVASAPPGKTTSIVGRSPSGHGVASLAKSGASEDQGLLGQHRKDLSDFSTSELLTHQAADSSAEALCLGGSAVPTHGKMNWTVGQQLLSQPELDVVSPPDELKARAPPSSDLSMVHSLHRSSSLHSNYGVFPERSSSRQDLLPRTTKSLISPKGPSAVQKTPRRKAAKSVKSTLARKPSELSQTDGSSKKEMSSATTSQDEVTQDASDDAITAVSFRGPGNSSSATQDLPGLHLQEKLKDNSNNDKSQTSLGPEEASRLWDKLKEQKDKSMRAIHHRLFPNRQPYSQGDDLSCSVDPSTLNIGEFVVHKTVGVGRYIGLKNEVPPGKVNPSKYIYLKYADGVAKLKAKQARRLLYRYHLPGEVWKPPTLSKIKDPGLWEKRKHRGQLSVQKMVINMMELYIHRLNQSRPPYPKNKAGVAQFSMNFPYTPTPDQSQAFADVERDMTERDLPMDRLICGDVGFGKTEVALRAIFICAAAGKQVMVLAPSTVLAKQHFETIRDRFANFPAVKVALLCRFQKDSARKDLILRIHDGSLTVVVGTHSLLGSQMQYQNLGLLVIDEEQRFGVKQKEKITSLKKSVDVLTLSATPIPRTLYYALSGLRDASLLTTPPPERRPIQTHLGQYDEVQARAAIKFELNRGGQVFYVVPKVRGIEKLQEILQSQFPDIEVSIAHGKQSPSALEESMRRFCDGETKILICTNIIESGLDIRMVNTIIVEDVHHFGLAQLYQLRGRVGRAQREAHAYLFHPHKSCLTNEALERLVALQDCCELGQGFQLAERDMAIRGIGSLFGEQQSGDIAKIGTDLYIEMLLQGLAKVDSQRVPQIKFEEMQLDLGVDVHIPSDYIRSPQERATVIKNIEVAARESLSALVSATNRLRDKYGKEPPSMEMLLKTMYVRRMAADLGIHRIRTQGTSILMETNMSNEAFEMIASTILSDSMRSSLTFGSGCIEMQGLLGLPQERQMERIYSCLTDMFNGLPSFVKHL